MGPNLHANWLALRFRVNVAFVVDDPIKILVSVQRHHILPAAVAAINFLKKVKPRVVAIFRDVRPIAVVVQEGCQVIILAKAWVAVGGVIVEVIRHHIPSRKVHIIGSGGHGVVVLSVPLGVGTVAHRKTVVFLASLGGHLGRSVGGQWTRPEVVAVGAVTHGSQLQLLVRADASNPQGTPKDHGNPILFGDEVGPQVVRAVVPQRAAIFHQCLDVVPLQVLQGGGGGAGFRARAAQWLHHRHFHALHQGRAWLQFLLGGCVLHPKKARKGQQGNENGTNHGRGFNQPRRYAGWPHGGFPPTATGSNGGANPSQGQIQATQGHPCIPTLEACPSPGLPPPS